MHPCKVLPPHGHPERATRQGGTNVYQLTDAVDITRGGHALHVGFTFRAMQENTLGDTAFAGLFAFNNLFTAALGAAGTPTTGGNTIASVLMGYPTTGARNVPIFQTTSYQFKSTEHAANLLLKHLAAACQPRRMEVTLDYRLRGGIRTVVTVRHPS